MNEYKITINVDALHTKLEEFERLCDSNQHWNAIRVSPYGTIYISTEPSRCFGEDEYYHRMPHTVTVKEQHGAGQCDLPDDWSDEDGALIEEAYRCIDLLEDAGYEVEETGSLARKTV